MVFRSSSYKWPIVHALLQYHVSYHHSMLCCYVAMSPHCVIVLQPLPPRLMRWRLWLFEQMGDRYVPIRSSGDDSHHDNNNSTPTTPVANDNIEDNIVAHTTKGHEMLGAEVIPRPLCSRRCRACAAVILVALGAIAALVITQFLLPASDSHSATVYIVVNTTIWTGTLRSLCPVLSCGVINQLCYAMIPMSCSL